MLDVRPFSKRDSRFNELAGRAARENSEAGAKAGDAVRRVRERGGQGLLECVREMDSPAVRMDSLRVSEAELIAARDAVSEQFLTSLSLARVNARKFHEYQRRRGYVCDDSDQVILSRQVRALGRVGILAGKSFSSLLMHAVPAMVAGVGQIAAAVRPEEDGSVDPRILAAAKVLGIDEVHRMSGAHAVAAFAFGAGPVAKADKIVGSGGAGAAAAKRIVSGHVGVDAGGDSSELLVIADDSANARFIAGDFLAQAEQESAGMLVLLATDRMVAEAVRIELERLADSLLEPGRIRENLARAGAIYVCRSLQAAVDAANILAPARLALQTRFNDECLADIETAGAVFVGPWSAETAGGCFSGINPFLPDGGRARFSSGLGVEDFVREMTVVQYGPDRLLRTGRHHAILAEEENFTAQAEAVRERLELLKMAAD